MVILDEYIVLRS